jgi:hypothetical protein
MTARYPGLRFFLVDLVDCMNSAPGAEFQAKLVACVLMPATFAVGPVEGANCEGGRGVDDGAVVTRENASSVQFCALVGKVD